MSEVCCHCTPLSGVALLLFAPLSFLMYLSSRFSVDFGINLTLFYNTIGKIKYPLLSNKLMFIN